MSLYHRRLLIGFIYTGIPMIGIILQASGAHEAAAMMLFYGLPMGIVGVWSFWAAFSSEPKIRDVPGTAVERFMHQLPELVRLGWVIETDNERYKPSEQGVKVASLIVNYDDASWRIWEDATEDQQGAAVVVILLKALELENGLVEERD